MTVFKETRKNIKYFKYPTDNKKSRCAYVH